MPVLTDLDGTNKDDVINLIYGFGLAVQFVPTITPPGPFPAYAFISYLIETGNGNDIVVGGFGDDTIDGGNGNDTLMGFLGTNTLYGGAGDDHLVGLLASVGTPTNPFVIAFTTIGSANILFGGDGNDTLVGRAANVTGTVANPGNYLVDFAGNSLDGGAGDDHLYGVYINLSLVPTVSVPGMDLKTFFRSNTLDGGAGNDYLVGNYDSINVVLANLQAAFVDNYLGNQLYGGGGNDTLIGNNGTFSETFTSSSGSNIHNFGSDRLDGGSGDDLLIGDIHTMNITINNSNWHQEERYGADTLIGGQGNDTLVGDVLNSVRVDSIQLFGNDTFVFAIGGQNGNDTVKDMNAGGVNDTLQFSGAASVAAVDAASTFSNSGGHVLMSFDGGSVLFENINWASQHSVLEITSHVVVI